MTLVLWTHSGPPGAKHEAGSASAASGTRKRLQDGTHIFFCLFQFYLFWLHWLFIAVFRFSLVAASRGYSSSCVQASHCSDLSRCGAEALGMQGFSS